MWDERISLVRAFADAITERDVEAALEVCHPEIEFFSLMAQLEASPYRGFAGIRRYFRDIDATWEEWRVEVERLLSAPDGRVMIVMSTHMRGKGSGLPFVQRVANLWEFKDEKLWCATLYRDPAEALRATELPPLEHSSGATAIAGTTIRGMIAGAHTIIFAEDAERARAFLRDVLGFEGVDAGDGWLIFALPPGEVAVHPGSGWGRGPGHHALFLMCHDIEQTVAELEGKGVEFVSPIEDEGWGRIARFKIPGAGEIGVYEPQHPSPLPEFTPRG